MTPNGLDVADADGNEHSASAADMARIMRYCAFQSPCRETFLEITRTASRTIQDESGNRSFYLANHNALLSQCAEEMCIRDRMVDLNKLGAVVTKGVANVPWPGNPTPRIAEVYGGMINAIGLQNPGYDLFASRDIPFLRQYDTKIIVTVCGKTTEDYVDVVEKLASQPVDMLEINISCPNVTEGGIA